MVAIDTLEGMIDGGLWYHYDVGSGCALPAPCFAARDTAAVGEETDDGFILLRGERTRPIGLTIVSWWKRFGQGQLPDSISQIQSQIEPWGRKLAA